MFLKAVDYILGKNKVEITGLNIDRLINELINKGIVLNDIQRVSHRVVIVCVTDKMLKKLLVYIKPLWYNVTVLYNFSLINSLKTLLTKRLGLLMGLIAAIVIVAICSLFVWDIKVIGNEIIKDDIVFEKLGELGVKKGCLINDIDRKEIARNLTIELSESSLISIEIKGVTLIVNIKERITRPDQDNQEFSDEIVSGFDCQITKIALLNGTVMVRSGDIVKKGEILGAAYEDYYEGSEKIRKSIRAEGEFWGKVWFTSTRYCATESVQYKQTGNSKTHFIWEMFFKNRKIKPSPYSLYESKSEVIKLDFLLPLTIYKTKYYELKPELVGMTLEQAQALYGAEVLEEARQKVDKEAVILNSYIRAYEENGLIRIDGVVETEMKVGTRLKK